MYVSWNSASLLLFAVCFLAITGVTDSRQMCFTCQYSNKVSPECVTDPAAWRNGDPRVQCPFDCITNAVYNAASGKPSFVYRGCQAANRENGCVTIGAAKSCYFACEGKNYCNNRNMTFAPEANSNGVSALPSLPVLWNFFCACFISALMMPERLL